MKKNYIVHSIMAFVLLQGSLFAYVDEGRGTTNNAEDAIRAIAPFIGLVQTMQTNFVNPSVKERILKSINEKREWLVSMKAQQKLINQF